MTKVRKAKTKTKFEVIDSKCLGRSCLVLGVFQHRGASGMGCGSHSNGHSTPCCMTNAYRGCPNNIEEKFSQEKYDQAIKDGWKIQ